MNRTIVTADLDTVDTVLIDFDGPICAVFAGYPAPQVAAKLLARATELGAKLEVADTDDPIAVIHALAGQSAHIVLDIEATLEREEERALELTRPHPEATALLRRLHAAGKQLAVVTNNGEHPAAKFLKQHHMSEELELVVGREATDPTLLKPSPYLVRRALAELHAHPDSTAFIGDSISDIAAALAAGVTPIGYANKPGKRDRLLAAGATVVVDRLDQLAPSPADGDTISLRPTSSSKLVS